MSSARESILCFKHDIPAMQKNSSISKMLLADALFENFVEYASANWDYITEASNLSADALLASADHNRVDCAKLREALKKMFEEDLGLDGVSNANLDSSNKCGHFITKPDFHCFDSKVRGNVGNQGSGAFNLGCFFTTHYFLKYGGKYYDACMAATYRSEQEPILHKTRKVGTVYKGLENVRWAGTGKATILLRSTPKNVPGFSSVWEIFKLDEVKRIFSKQELNVIQTTPELQGLI